MRKKSILNSPRLLEIKKQKRQILKRKVLLLFIAFLILLVALCFVVRIPKINIHTVEVSGNKVIDTEVIQGIVEKELEGSYFWLIPKTNFLFYPKYKIIRELEDQYKRLTDIEIKVRGAQTLEVSVKERVGLYTWCGEDLPAEGVNFEDVKCYFMDAQGYIFDQAPYFSGDVYFKFFGPLGDGTKDMESSNFLESPAGHYFIPELFVRVVLLEDTLSQMGTRVMALYVKDKSEMEFYLESSGSIRNAPKIIVNQDADFIKIAENLDAALTTEPLKTDFKQKYSSLLYIDLRFGNKVYFKFK